MTVTDDVRVSGLPDGAILGRLGVGSPRLASTRQTAIEAVSDGLTGLTCILPSMGEWQEPASPWTIQLDRPAWVLLSVHALPDHGLDATWLPLPHGVVWRFEFFSRFHADLLFAKRCPAGPVVIPGHAGRSPRGFFARPHLVLIAEELPGTPAPGQDREALLAELLRIESVELRSGGLQATVQLKPTLRLTAFGDGVRPQLLAPPVEDPCGIRTWFMEPFQIQRSPQPSSLRARCLEQGPDRVLASTDPEPCTGLEVVWEVRIEPHRLLIRHGLRNHANRSRRLAVWAICVGADPLAMRSVLRRTAGVSAPAMSIRPMKQDGDGEPGPLIAPLAADLPGCHDLPGGLVIDGGTRSGRSMKAGLRSPEGIAALTLGRTALISRVIATDPGPYPEGDLNLTTYHARSVIEVEHVGPLVDVAPGACAWLEQELRLGDLPEHGVEDLPGIIGAS